MVSANKIFPKSPLSNGVSIGLLLLPILFILGGCSHSSKNEDERKEYQIPELTLRSLKFDTVKFGPMVNAFTLTGQVDFDQDNVVNIYPLISGVVQDVKFVLGDFVEKGQVLGVVRSAEMAQYSSDLLNAQANLAVAQQTMDKTLDMYNGGLASKSDSTAAAAVLQQAKAELTRTQRVMKINGDNTQGEYVIKAPISGFIVQKFVTNNQVIRTDNGGALFTISDLKQVWVWANLYESNVSNVHVGDDVEVTTLSHPDKVFKGKVDKMMQMLDPTSKALKVRIVIPNPDYLFKPQMFASVTVTNQTDKKVLCVPSSSLIFDHSQYFLLRYSGNGKAQILPVQKLSSNGAVSYLSGGVSPGEKIIASSALQIYSELNN